MKGPRARRNEGTARSTENGGGERRRAEGESDGERRGRATENGGEIDGDRDETRTRFRLEGEDRD